MMSDDLLIQWLLEDNNLAVKYRTQTELLGMDKHGDEVSSTLVTLCQVNG
ncbi:hypothetical protein AGMMS50284_7130 [Clostridia bacterium]|nr:hypothetical protein AGMMS50284_7130 [Clostridia bacterium]